MSVEFATHRQPQSHISHKCSILCENNQTMDIYHVQIEHSILIVSHSSQKPLDILVDSIWRPKTIVENRTHVAHI